MLSIITSHNCISSLTSQPPNTSHAALTLWPTTALHVGGWVPHLCPCWHTFMLTRRKAPSLMLQLNVHSVGDKCTLCGKICFLFENKSVLRVTWSNCSFKVQSQEHHDCCPDYITNLTVPGSKWLQIKLLRFLYWKDDFVIVRCCSDDIPKSNIGHNP